MTTLRKLQLVILSIAKDIDELCKRNNIEYHLIAGSAIGAVRHKGFIPWDDDLDIEMTDDNYRRFLQVCHTQLDKDKYYVQEGVKDWPQNFTKIKLLGTKITEKDGYSVGEEKDCVFIDVFKLDEAATTKPARLWQFFCGKYRLCYLQSLRHNRASLSKKIMMMLAFPQKNKAIREFFRKQTEKYNGKQTGWYGNFFGKTRWHNCFLRADIVEQSVRIPFEDTTLPVPIKYDEYLRHLFGDYMKLPPLKEQRSNHFIEADFGSYDPAPDATQNATDNTPHIH